MTRVDDLGIAAKLVDLPRMRGWGAVAGLGSKAMLLLKVKALSQGHSGVAVTTCSLARPLERGSVACGSEPGFVGASGDLAACAPGVAIDWRGGSGDAGRAANGFLGRLARAGRPVLELGPKEGLALINGTQMMLEPAGGARTQTRLADWADALGACPSKPGTA